MKIGQAFLDIHYVHQVSDTLNMGILCVQEVVTPIYIVTHYINWGNYFLDTQYETYYYFAWIFKHLNIIDMKLLYRIRSIVGDQVSKANKDNLPVRAKL